MCVKMIKIVWLIVRQFHDQNTWWKKRTFHWIQTTATVSVLSDETTGTCNCWKVQDSKLSMYSPFHIDMVLFICYGNISSVLAIHLRYIFWLLRPLPSLYRDSEAFHWRYRTPVNVCTCCDVSVTMWDFYN